MGEVCGRRSNLADTGADANTRSRVRVGVKWQRKGAFETYSYSYLVTRQPVKLHRFYFAKQ
jgi:hypothetical protein